ncbi:hypothetical protein [Duganella sp. LjRoot269]|jgi:hypothetical protein|uniref:hypothetical protein n=1 Tax=Duganella sp. LjRoot269 TaxID=3342305 RepID=UPI00159DC780
MKFSTLGAGAALILAAALAGCGGKAQFAVQGTIAGLNNDGLVLANGSDTVKVPAGASSFVFPHQIPYGTDYNITIQTQPAHMSCSLGGASGSAGHNVAIAAQVVCNQSTHTLGGQFTGLFQYKDATSATPDTLLNRSVVLLNGSTGGQLTVSSPTDSSGKGDFVFGSQVADGQAYGVTILTQPVGATCTLVNGTGVMHENNVSNLVLTCTTN